MNIYFNKYVTLIFNLKNYGHVTRNYPIHVIALVFSSIFSCGEELFNLNYIDDVAISVVLLAGLYGSGGKNS